MGVSGMSAMTNTGTISAWIKLETTASSADLFRAYEDADNNIRIFYHAGDNELRFNYRAGGTSNIANITDAIEGDGVWYHVAGTWDKDGNAKIYLDGTLKETTAISGTFSGSFTTAAIGNNTQSGNYWIGNIDEVSIFSVELNQTAVTALYNEWIPYTVAPDTGLIGWWRMGDGNLTGEAIATYPTIIDETGNNDGTMTNMTSTDLEADVPE
jgi:hypothetical protein